MVWFPWLLLCCSQGAYSSIRVHGLLIVGRIYRSPTRRNPPPDALRFLRTGCPNTKYRCSVSDGSRPSTPSPWGCSAGSPWPPPSTKTGLRPSPTPSARWDACGGSWQGCEEAAVGEDASALAVVSQSPAGRGRAAGAMAAASTGGGAVAVQGNAGGRAAATAESAG